MFAVLAGCTGTGQVGYSAQVTTPNLVYVSPDVQVIADYDEPVFYNESFYWRFSGGVWYRSRYHTRDWVRVEAVPVAIRRIDRPTAYIRYRGEARGEVRDQRPAPGPVIRDHRDQPAPVVVPVERDHRDDKAIRQEIKEERKEERKEDMREQKEERKEQKEIQKDIRKEQKEVQKDIRKDQKEVEKDIRKDQKEVQKDIRKDEKQERKDDRKQEKKEDKQHKH